MDLLAKEFIFKSDIPIDKKITPNISLKSVKNINDLVTFYKLTWDIYKNDRYWVPPFWKELKAFFYKYKSFWNHSSTKLFIVYKNNKPVGRIAGIIDKKYNEYKNKNIGYFGFFECINDYEVSQILLNAVTNWLKTHSITEMRGPINGMHIDIGVGFFLEGANTTPYILSNHCPSYYCNLAEAYGMQKIKDFILYNIDLKKPIPNEVKKQIHIFNFLGISVRKFKRHRFSKEMCLFFNLYNEIYADHWGYIPLDIDEMMERFDVKQLKWIINPQLFLFVEDKGKPIGFRWSLPNYNTIFKKLNGKLGLFELLKIITNYRKIQNGKFISMGLKKDYRGKGIGTYLNYLTLIEMKKLGYKSAEYGWIVEENIASRRAGEKIGAQIYKKYRTFSKKI